jgi:hypothetical protein
MKRISKRALGQYAARKMKKYLDKRKALVDWLSGIGELLRITNKAIHHSVVVLDLYAARTNEADFDEHMMALCALLVSAKFVQMRYPSAESLNSATDYAYSYDQIISMEGHLLDVIDWDLTQYPIFEFLNVLLAHGCLLETDEVLVTNY